MSKIVALYHIKGGVGKTASAVNLSYLAARSGFRTLICDLDPQSSATFYFRVKPKLKAGAKSLVKGGKKLESNIRGTDFENLDLLPSDLTLRNLDLKLDRTKKSKSRLDSSLAPLRKRYDLIFLDCPPNITMVAENIFRAADVILVPLVPTTLSLRTFAQLIEFAKINGYRRKNIFAFFSMVEKRKKLHRETMEQWAVNNRYRMSGSIPYSSDVEKMGLQREPLPVFAPRSRSALSYEALWREMQSKLL